MGVEVHRNLVRAATLGLHELVTGVVVPEVHATYDYEEQAPCAAVGEVGARRCGYVRRRERAGHRRGAGAGATPSSSRCCRSAE